MEVLFLGSGGGRFATITQRKRTGGFRITFNKEIMQVDPGPGAILTSSELGLDPRRVTSLFVTHCHPDHYTDAEVVIEAMTYGMTRRRGVLLSVKSVLEGDGRIGPAISKYHRERVKESVMMEAGEEFSLGGYSVRATEAKHSDPYTVGFQLRGNKDWEILSYTSDTEYYRELEREHSGARVLIANVTRPGKDRIRWHLCTEDALRLADEIGPELMVVTHMGLKMIQKGPESECQRIEEETGVRTIPADTGLRVIIDKDSVSFKKMLPRQSSLLEFGGANPWIKNTTTKK